MHKQACQQAKTSCAFVRVLTSVFLASRVLCKLPEFSVSYLNRSLANSKEPDVQFAVNGFFFLRNKTHKGNDTRKSLTPCRQDVLATGLQQVCEQVVTPLLFHQAATIARSNLFSWDLNFEIRKKI